MGEFTDKIKGVANEVAGKGKQLAGDAADRPDIEAEGAAQEATGVKGKVLALGERKGWRWLGRTMQVQQRYGHLLAHPVKLVGELRFVRDLIPAGLRTASARAS